MSETKQYVVSINHNQRLRTTISKSNQDKHIDWAVQLEFDSPDMGWEWIARYDTAGGNAHRDRNLIAQHEAITFSSNPGVAIQTAQKDLSLRAIEYIEAYLEAKRTRGES